MRSALQFIAAAAAFLAVVFAGRGRADEKKTLDFGGYKREYYVHVPPEYDAATPLPLVLGLHGGGGKAAQFDKLTRMNATADEYVFIAVYPQGLDNAWNDGREGINKLKRKTDDVAFLSELCKVMTRDYKVDPQRIYCCGISNGAMMSFRVAADAPDLFAAVCGVAGGVTDELVNKYPPAGRVPVMMVVGDADPLVPYGGGDIEVFGLKRGKVLPQSEAAAFWAANNGCAMSPVVTEFADADPEDGCRVVEELFKSDERYDVAFFTVKGGGHTWPSGWQYLPVKIVGKTANDIDNDVMWSFFAAHPRAEAATSP